MGHIEKREEERKREEDRIGWIELWFFNYFKKKPFNTNKDYIGTHWGDPCTCYRCLGEELYKEYKKTKKKGGN